MSEKLKLGILISGGGTTAEAVIRACQAGRLDLEPVMVISSRKNAGGIEKAERLGVPTEVVKPRDYGTGEEFGERLLSVLEEYGVEMVSQNGWMVRTPINVIECFPERIINQHPGPLDGERPDFGGRGMYGVRVICARGAYEAVTGEEPAWTEATVHRVTENYDEGPIIRKVRVEFSGLGRRVTMEELTSDSEDLIRATKEIQGRLLPIEHENVIGALAMMIRGENGLERRAVPLIPEANWKILKQAKELAIGLYPRR